MPQKEAELWKRRALKAATGLEIAMSAVAQMQALVERALAARALAITDPELVKAAHVVDAFRKLMLDVTDDGDRVPIAHVEVQSFAPKAARS